MCTSNGPRSKNKVSPRTIQRELRRLGFFDGKIKKREKLSARHKQLRIEYAQITKDMSGPRCSGVTKKHLNSGHRRAMLGRDPKTEQS